MGLLFKDDLLDEFGRWALAYIPFGGPDFGELAAVGAAVGDGDAGAYYRAWIDAGDRAAGEAGEAAGKGRTADARDLFLRASVFYNSAYHPLYGAPTDPRLVAAYRKQIAAMNSGLALSDPPVLPLTIPFEGASMPAYFIPAAGFASETRPLVIFTNGYDGTVTDMYFASAVAASRHGFHSLIFDGPGQGAMLYEQGIPIRPDWEVVVRTVVDFALELPLVDPAKIALNGWSFGGYLAARAATGEHRIAALVADPIQLGLAEGFRGIAMKLGASVADAANLVHLEPAVVAAMQKIVDGNPSLRWKIVQRGLWVHGLATIPDYLKAAETFTIKGRIAEISCPVMMTLAETDTLAKGTEAVAAELKVPYSIVPFASAEGAGDHCEMQNRSLLNRRTFAWLDAVFAGEVR